MTSFQDFLLSKTEGSGWRERKERRLEWLGALKRLDAQIREFLHEADPMGVLEIIDYEVERVEEPLGVYDAPALKIRLATESVEIVPVGRTAPKPATLLNLLSLPGNAQRWGGLSGGRVDITDGERRHMLFRSIEDGQDRWYVAMARKTGVVAFDRDRLEEILQDLLA